MTPLRLVHVLTVAEPLRFLDAQLAFMQARGVDAAVVPSDGPEHARLSPRVRSYVLPLERRIAAGDDAKQVARLASLLRAKRAHVVHAHVPKGGLLGVIGFVGRLAIGKGIRELVDAFEGVRAHAPHARLLLVGGLDVRDGPPSEWVARVRPRQGSR